MAWTRVSTVSSKKNSPWQRTRLASSRKAMSLVCLREPEPVSRYGPNMVSALPELLQLTYFMLKASRFLLSASSAASRSYSRNEAVEGGLGDAVGHCKEALLDAEAIDGPLVGVQAAEVRLGGVDRFEEVPRAVALSPRIDGFGRAGGQASAGNSRPKVGRRAGTERDRPGCGKNECVACWKAAIGQSAGGNVAFWRWSEILRVGRYAGRTSRPFRRRPIGRRTAAQQGCTDRTLIPSETEARPAGRSGRSGRRSDLADRRCDAAGDGRVGGTPKRCGPSRLSRRILSTIQTLTVRPQPHRRWRLLQKIRRARTVRRGLLSSKPVRTPCRMSVPTVRQCGHGVSLSRSMIAAHSASSR